jgi:hypothetical protein
MLNSELMSLAAQPGRPWTEMQVPRTQITADTADISPYVEFQWWEVAWCYYPKDQDADLGVLAHWLRPSFDVGMFLTDKLLTERCSFVNRLSLQPLSEEDENNPAIVERTKAMDKKIRARVKTQADVEAASMQEEDDEGNVFYDALPMHERYEDDSRERTVEQPGS